VEIEKDKKIAVLFGVENAVGSECLQLLLNHDAYGKVVVYADPSFKRHHTRLQILPLQEIKNHTRTSISGHDLFFCTTGIFKSFSDGGDEAAAGLSLILPVAKKALAGGMNQFLVLSSSDADPDAILPLARMRGQMAQVLQQMPFWAVHVFKSATILKKSLYNQEGERLGAFLRKNIAELTGDWLSNHVPVEAAAVAGAMVAAAQHIKQGFFVYDTPQIEKMSKGLT
jgi:hypothetical protein